MRGKLAIAPQKKYATQHKEANKGRSNTTVEPNNSYMKAIQIFWFKHKVNKREIEPEADLANVA